MKNDKLNLALASLSAFLLGITLTLVGGNLVRSGLVGAPSGPEIENYVPIIMQDNGYFSRKGIYTTSTLQADGVSTFGSATLSGTLAVTGATTLGTSGTAVIRLNAGTCNLNFGNAPASITASTTVNVDCQASNMLSTATIAQSALTGVNVNDIITVEQATTTPTTFEGATILSANASSTQGYITVKLYNGTGANMTPGTTTAAGVQYIAIDN